MENDRIESIEIGFKRRFKIKKLVNLLVCAVIAVLGVTSFVYILNYDGDGFLTFRWMTVDGTVFSTAIAIIYCVASILEMAKYTEITFDFVYYLRLASAVAEGLIIAVVLLSQLPFSPQHMHILRYDMFNMHIVIPILTVASFVFNDSPAGKLKAGKILHGMWFVALYAVTVVALIVSGTIPEDMVPYAFVDVLNMPAFAIILSAVFIFGLGFLLSFVFYRLNKKFSWIWFKKIASKKKIPHGR